MKRVAQSVAFVIGTFIVVAFRSGDGSVSIGDLLFGAFIGGGIASALVGAFFKDEPTPQGQRKDSVQTIPIQENQQEIEQPIDPAEEMERRRVEKLGIEVAVCPSCQTLNSLSLLNCEKCNTNLEKVKPIRNPYI